ncbi:MAG: PAS domain S-box protein [Clostridiales bacterium]|nr:PAS domain S-box protein [Clostridiales bacterium]
MPYRFSSYLWLLIISGLMSLSLGVYTIIKHRHAKGATSFAIAMFIVTLWSIPNSLEMSAAVLDVKLFWANIQYIAYCFSPVALLILCLKFSGHEKYLKFKNLFWIFIIPTITIILVWTDKYHGLVRNNIHMDYSGAFPVIKKQYGPFFYIHALHSHGLNLTTIYFLFRAVLRRKTIYRRQALALLIGIGLIFIPNLLYISGISPIKGHDITPIFFGPAGIIMAWSIFRYRMFDLVPLARATVIEDMDAGVMVLDLQDRILDINPAFVNIIGLPLKQITTKHIYEVSENIPELIELICDRTVSRIEFSVVKPEAKLIYEALLSILKDKNGDDIGRLVVIYDISEKKRAENEYYKEQWKLAVRNERNRMVRDLHDNLGQVLGFINMQAQGIQKELIDAGEDLFSKKLDKLIEVAQTAHQQIREYIHDMRNSDLIEIDFIAALDNEISNYELQTLIKVSSKITPEFSNAAIAPDIRIHILNIIKEVMNNVRKHAQAENILMSCDYLDNDLLVIIYDDGKGFDLETNKESKQGFGLSIIQERASEMGGTIEIQSKHGEGSCIKLRVPLDRGDTNEV